MKAQETSPDINVLSGAAFSSTKTGYASIFSADSYDDNMAAFGVVSLNAPSSISLYADSFEAKDAISGCIDAYNQSVSEEYQITYTDYVALLTGSVTTIVNVISYPTRTASTKPTPVPKG